MTKETDRRSSLILFLYFKQQKYNFFICEYKKWMETDQWGFHKVSTIQEYQSIEFCVFAKNVYDFVWILPIHKKSVSLEEEWKKRQSDVASVLINWAVITTIRMKFHHIRQLL